MLSITSPALIGFRKSESGIPFDKYLRKGSVLARVGWECF